MFVNVIVWPLVALLLAAMCTPLTAAAAVSSSSNCPDLPPAANNASSINISTLVVIRAPCTFTNVRLNIDILGAQSSTAAPTTDITIDGAAFHHDPSHADGACVSATGVAGITRPVLLTVRNSLFAMLPGAVATTKVFDFVEISSFAAGMLPAGSAITIQNNTFRAAWIALSGSGALLAGALLLRGDLVLVSSNVTFADNILEMEYISGRGAELYGVRAIAGGGPTTNLHVLNRSVIMLAGNSVAWRHSIGSLVFDPTAIPSAVALLRTLGTVGSPDQRLNVTISGQGSALVVSRNTITMSNLTLAESVFSGFAAIDPLSDLCVSAGATMDLNHNHIDSKAFSSNGLNCFVLSLVNVNFVVMPTAAVTIAANAMAVTDGSDFARLSVSVMYHASTVLTSMTSCTLHLVGNDVLVSQSRASTVVAGILNGIITVPFKVNIVQSLVHVSSNRIAVTDLSQSTMDIMSTSPVHIFIARFPGTLKASSLVVDAFNRIHVSRADASSLFEQDLSLSFVELPGTRLIEGGSVLIEGGSIALLGPSRFGSVVVAGLKVVIRSDFADGSVASVRKMRVAISEISATSIDIDYASLSGTQTNLNSPALIAVRENCATIQNLMLPTTLSTVTPIHGEPLLCGLACTEVVESEGCSATATLSLVVPETLTASTPTQTETQSIPDIVSQSPAHATSTVSRRVSLSRSDTRASTASRKTPPASSPSSSPSSSSTHQNLLAPSNDKESRTPSPSVASRSIAWPPPPPAPTTFALPPADPGPAGVTGTVVATGVIGVVSTPISASVLNSIQLLAIFSVMACQVPGAGDAGMMRRFLTPVGLDGSSGALAGNVLVAAGLTVFYGAVFAVIARVLRSRERARRLLRHPQALPLLHLLTLPGLAFEAATLLYGDAAATAGERVFGGAVLALCCASAGAYCGVSAYYHARVAPLEATVVRPRWGPAELAARVPRAVRALLVPAAGWTEAVRAGPRCVYVGLRPMAPAGAHHAVAGHSALRVLLVCVVCAVRPGAEWHCTAVLSVAGVVCAAHAALLLALRPLRIPVSNPLQAAQSAAVGGVAFIRAGNGPVAVATAFTIILIVAALLSSLVLIGSFLSERRYQIFTPTPGAEYSPSTINATVIVVRPAADGSAERHAGGSCENTCSGIDEGMDLVIKHFDENDTDATTSNDDQPPGKDAMRADRTVSCSPAVTPSEEALAVNVLNELISGI